MRLNIMFAALLLCAGTAEGQTPLPETGSRLRLSFPCDGRGQAQSDEGRSSCRAVGELVRLQAGTITLAAGDSTSSYEVNRLRRIEMSQGVRSKRLLGAGIGFAVGTGVAYVALNSGGSTSLCDRSANQDAASPGGCVALGLLGGIAGAGLGMIVGGLFHSERWQQVPLERVRVSLRPQVGETVGFRVALSF